MVLAVTGSTAVNELCWTGPTGCNSSKKDGTVARLGFLVGGGFIAESRYTGREQPGRSHGKVTAVEGLRKEKPQV